MSVVAIDSNDAHEKSIDRAAGLRDLDPIQLLERFKNGTAPETLRVLDGDPRGLGISLQWFTRSRFHRWLKRYAEKSTFPWHGKSFKSRSDTEGWGWNRLGISGILTIFPFKTSLGNSVVDGRPAFIIDYNVKRNPWYERLCWDELREVDPGVFLGFTSLRLFGRYPIVLWFAVDITRADTWNPV